MANEREVKAREFFCAPEPSLEIKIICLGIGVALAGILTAAYYSWLIGLLMIALGALAAIFLPIEAEDKGDAETEEPRAFSLAKYFSAKKRYEDRPTDDDMRAWLESDLKQIAREQLDMEETAKFVYNYTPIYSKNLEDFDSKDVLRRRGKYGDYLYSTYSITVLLLSDRFMGVYRADYNLIKQVTGNEHTAEFFYKDVVAMETYTKASSRYYNKSGEKTEHAKSFSLVLSSGKTIDCGIVDPKYISSKDDESLGSEVIRTVRSMLRHHKWPHKPDSKQSPAGDS